MRVETNWGPWQEKSETPAAKVRTLLNQSVNFAQRWPICLGTCTINAGGRGLGRLADAKVLICVVRGTSTGKPPRKVAGGRETFICANLMPSAGTATQDQSSRPSSIAPRPPSMAAFSNIGQMGTAAYRSVLTRQET